MFQPSPENLKRTLSPAEIANLKMREIFSIQIALIEDFVKDKDEKDKNKEAEEWVKKNGESFREIITDELIDFWKENEEEAKDKIKELLENSDIKGN